MAMAKTNFDSMRSEFKKAVRASMEKNDLKPVEIVYRSMDDSAQEKRAALDQSFRDYLLLLLGNKQDTLVWEKFLSRCVEASRQKMSTITLPVILLGDIFESLTLDRCKQLFRFVESGVSIWKEELFFNPCKLILLRMCNDLLRRLYRSQNKVFRARILLFLAKFFPLSECSGLNIDGEFNVDNITKLGVDESKETENKLDESISDVSSDKIKIDDTLYTKFWALQHFFRNPIQVYDKLQWMTFVAYTKDILSAFKSSKLDGVQNKKRVLAEQMVTQSTAAKNNFAKYITNQKVLEQQLCDGNFWRYVLTQFLILFQYLNTPVKFKNENQELTPTGLEWIAVTSKRVYSLLKETPPDGETFVKSVQHLLQRENNWITWKNDGCPTLPKPPAEEKKGRVQIGRKPQKKPLGEVLKEMHAQKKFYFGNDEMTQMWNHMPDNLAACRAPERNFRSTLLDEYFMEAKEQLDPAAVKEGERKVVNDRNFGWRGLRLMAQQSSQFFTHNNNNFIETLPEYLESMIQKEAKHRPMLLPSGDVKPELPICRDAIETTTVLENDAEVENDDDLMKEDKQNNSASSSNDDEATGDETTDD